MALLNGCDETDSDCSASSDSGKDESDGPYIDPGTILDQEDFLQQLCACLDDFQYDGTFFRLHSFSSYINPSLHISNYGTLGLPLSVRDVEAIAGISKPSPLGK